MTLPIVNVKTGQIEPIDNPEEAFLQGTHGFNQGEKVNFFNPEDNKLYSADASKAQEFLESGLRFARPEEVEERRLQKEYGEGLGASAKSLGEGVARGLSFGLSDIVLQDLDIVSKEALKERKDRNKALSIGGEVLGSVAPILLSAGTGAAAKGASLAPSALLSKAGTRLEKELAKKIIKEGAAKKILPKVAAEAAEGSIYGLANLTSEAALGNKELTADNVVANMGMGALLGGGLAASLGIGKMAGGKAISGAQSVIAKMPEPVKSLKELEDLFTIKATGAMKPQIKQIESMRIAGGDKGKVADILRQRGIIGKGAPNFGATKKVAADELKKVGQELDEVINRLDQGAKKNGIETDFNEVWEKVNERVLRPLKGSEFGNEQRLGERLTKDFEGFAEKWQGQKIPLKDLINYRRRIRKMAWKGKSKITQDTYGQYLDDIGGVLKEAEEEFADRIASQLDIDNAYKNAKENWQVIDWANKALGNKVDSETANLYLSLTDRMAGIGGGTAAALAQGAINPAAIAMAAGSSLFNRTIRTRGAALASNILNKVNNLQLLQKVNSKIDSQIANSAKKFFESTPRVSTPTSVPIFMNTDFLEGRKKNYKSMQESFLAKKEEITNLAQNPETALEKIAQSTEKLEESAPEIVRSIQERQGKALRILFEKMPRKPGEPNAILDEEYIPPDSEISKWARYYSAVTNPLSVIEDLQEGIATKEGVEVLRDVYPSLYEKTLSEFMSSMAENKNKISYDKKMQLSILFEIPFTNYANPNFVGFLQKISSSPISSPPGRESSAARAKGLDNMDLSGRNMTALDRIGKGEI